MSQFSPSSASIDLLLQLLQSNTEMSEPTTDLARLDPGLLNYLQTKATGLHDRAISQARDVLDVVLESLDHPLSIEHQRCLIERADDELALAQRWSELAANARFYWERPELARQLAGDAMSEEAPVTGTDKTSKERARKRRGREAAPRV